MATVTAFDNINRLGGFEVRQTREDYFAEMDVTPEQRRKRIDLAYLLEEEVLLLFALYMSSIQHGMRVDKQNAERQYLENIREILRKAGIRESVIDKYVEDVAKPEIQVTDERHREGTYWTSDDRAKAIADNDSNIIWNGEEYAAAVTAGKSRKQWVTMKDERVRPTHVDVDDKVIPIGDPFVVGDSLMMYPKDTSLGADVSEIAGCRCTALYF